MSTLPRKMPFDRSRRKLMRSLRLARAYAIMPFIWCLGYAPLGCSVGLTADQGL